MTTTRGINIVPAWKRFIHVFLLHYTYIIPKSDDMVHLSPGGVTAVSYLACSHLFIYSLGELNMDVSVPVSSQSCFHTGSRGSPFIVVGAAAGIWILSRSRESGGPACRNNKPGQVFSRGRSEVGEEIRRGTTDPLQNVLSWKPANPQLASLSFSCCQVFYCLRFWTLKPKKNQQIHWIIWSVISK